MPAESRFEATFDALTAAGIAFCPGEPAATSSALTLAVAPTDLARAVAVLAPLGYGTAANYPTRLILATPAGLELHLEPAP